MKLFFKNVVASNSYQSKRYTNKKIEKLRFEYFLFIMIWKFVHAYIDTDRQADRQTDRQRHIGRGEFKDFLKGWKPKKEGYLKRGRNKYPLQSMP